MKKIIISLRLEKIGKYEEERDNLDIRLSQIIEKSGYMPVLMPNNLKLTSQYLNQIRPKGVILSGGGDPTKKDKRLKNELNLIKYSLQKNIPLLGICRGAQVLNIFFGGKIKKIKNYWKKNKRIYGPLIKKKKIKINSYHDYGFTEEMLGKNLNPIAYSSDKIIKSFIHNKYKFFAIMWHPERYKLFKNFDKNLIKKFFK